MKPALERSDISAAAPASRSCATVCGTSASSDGRCSDVARRGERADDVQHPHLRAAGGMALSSRSSEQIADADLGGDDDPPPVEVVGERTAPEAENDDRDDLDETEQAHRDVRAGELLRLERDGDEREHRAEVGDDTRGEQQPEVPRGAQRGRVDAPA